MRRSLPLRVSITLLLACGALDAWAQPAGKSFLLPLRSRVQAFKNSDTWNEARFQQELPVRETAILICDMWDNHWCTAAARRVNLMVPRMAAVVSEARSHGLAVIHSPSDTMDFYKDEPQRRRILEIGPAQPPANLALADPPIPVGTQLRTCDSFEDKFFKAWTRQHAGIPVGPDDVISDKGAEVYSYMQSQGIQNLLVMGVHTNVCVLNRSFAIKQMTKWGVRCILVRDLTDSMYDPRNPPQVSHERGTDLVIEYIEKHWCPTTLSTEVLEALRVAK